MTMATNRNSSFRPNSNHHLRLCRSEAPSPPVARRIVGQSLPAVIAQTAALNATANDERRSEQGQHASGRFAPLVVASTIVWTFLVACCAALVWVATVSASAADDAAAVEQRLADVVQYLVSPDCEGRAVGGAGIDRAAQFIAEQFAAVGLKTDLIDGKPFQSFSVSVGNRLGPNNRLVFHGPAGPNSSNSNNPNAAGPTPKQQTIEAASGRDFLTAGLSAAAEFDAPLVFAGYGISAEKEGYDDFAGVDVKGKMLIILRHEPRQDDPDSPLDGTRDSIHATIGRKLANAEARGAAGVIFVTDEAEIRRNLAAARDQWLQAADRLSKALNEAHKLAEAPAAEFDRQRAKVASLAAEFTQIGTRFEADSDPLLKFSMARSGEKKLIVLHCRRSAIDPIIRAALGKGLAELEAEIDRDFKPRTAELAGWRAAGQTDLGRRQAAAKNVLALLPGDGPLVEETIVVGAHYDHLGLGDYGSLDRRPGLLHPGADDNASGVAAIIEIARQLAARPNRLPRSVLFVAFSGEELGLLGSKHYVAHPVVPLDKTVAMINFDMVGRLRNKRLTIFGVGTSGTWPRLLDQISVEDLNVARLPGGAGSSDQLPFYLQKIPALHFYTGMHGEYHRSTDTFETLNVPGMRRVVELSVRLIEGLAFEKERPKFHEGQSLFPAAKRRVTFGAVPEAHDSDEQNGFRLAGIVLGGPAEKAGLKTGDVVIEFGGRKVGNFYDFVTQLSKYEGGEKVKTVVRRGDQTLTFEVELEKRQ